MMPSYLKLPLTIKSGHRMGIYYCCNIYVGGIGDTLNYAPRLKPCREKASEPSNFIIHHHLKLFCPTQIKY